MSHLRRLAATIISILLLLLMASLVLEQISPIVVAQTQQQATATPEATAEATATVQPTPGTLPTSGGRPTAWPLIVLSTGVLSIIVGFGLNLFRRPKR